MKRYVLLITLIFLSSGSYTQGIRYSNNRLHNSPDYNYNIIGQIHDNIVVWKTNLDKQFDGEIFIYNSTMKLINTVRTNMLQSDIDPDPHFFVMDDSFKVIYRYQKEKIFSYRLAGFDENGNMKTIRALDSIEISEEFAYQPDFAYALLQSSNNQAACFVKIDYDAINNALRFTCNYIGKKTDQKDFAFSFDRGREFITDINIDDNSNILLAIVRSDTSTTLKIMKKNFSDNLMLVEEKAMGAYTFKENAVSIMQKPGGYVVFSKLNKENEGTHGQVKGLYVWQMDSVLNNSPGDTILDDKVNESNLLTFIPSGKLFSNVFALQEAYGELISEGTNSFAEARQNDQIAPPTFSYDEIGFLYFKPEQMSKMRHRESDPASSPKKADDFFYEVPAKKMEVFKLDYGNHIAWKHVFTDSIDNIATANLNNAKIIAGDKAIHLFYEVRVKNKPRSVNHVIVQADGTVTKSFLSSWDMRYKYLLDKGVLTKENDLIVTAVKGGQVKFAKIKIE